jgi:hypothetical protein
VTFRGAASGQRGFFRAPRPVLDIEKGIPVYNDEPYPGL